MFNTTHVHTTMALLLVIQKQPTGLEEQLPGLRHFQQTQAVSGSLFAPQANLCMAVGEADVSPAGFVSPSISRDAHSEFHVNSPG